MFILQRKDEFVMAQAPAVIPVLLLE
ncbi:hypothetical protein H734_17718 [Pseudomonas aeruginosa PA45]|nr:hypothetical protein H734_17718 [Pseudomonas aeruginosa PA45]